MLSPSRWLVFNSAWYKPGDCRKGLRRLLYTADLESITKEFPLTVLVGGALFTMPKKLANSSARKPLQHRPRPVLAHQVRIIGGEWKRTLLPVHDAEGLRPTPDRVRETVFNWLGHLLDGNWSQITCLDLFAGTGALGFEAASRGAAQVTMVEENTPAVRQLDAIKEKLHAVQVTIVRGDALTTSQQMLRTSQKHFDVIFLDPPYHQDWLPKMLPLCRGLLAPSGLVYVESEVALDGETSPEWLEGWDIVRADKAGLVFYHLLQRKLAPEIQA